jgi:metallophosphoesterase (TIGR00282 family)
MNILFIGDIVSKLGRDVVSYMCERLNEKYSIDFIIANGENATHGKGLSESHFKELLDAGVDVVTLGNHYGAKKEIFNYIDSYECVLRPNNLHKSIPGVGTNVFDCNGVKIRVTNLLGRAFMANNIDNPFDNLQEIVNQDTSDIHIVDFHAEATGEKYSLAYAFDGKVSAVLGTHTHVQTRDYRILDKGTAYMSDVGMCGPYNSILGTRKEEVISRTWTGMPATFDVIEHDECLFSAVLLEFDDATNKCLSIKPIYQIIQEEEL